MIHQTSFLNSDVFWRMIQNYTQHQPNLQIVDQVARWMGSWLGPKLNKSWNDRRWTYFDIVTLKWWNLNQKLCVQNWFKIPVSWEVDRVQSWNSCRLIKLKLLMNQSFPVINISARFFGCRQQRIVEILTPSLMENSWNLTEEYWWTFCRYWTIEKTGNGRGRQQSNYHQLKRVCRERNLLFEDPDFPASSRSLFTHKKPHLAPMTWQRPHVRSSWLRSIQDRSFNLYFRISIWDDGYCLLMWYPLIHEWIKLLRFI